MSYIYYKENRIIKGGIMNFKDSKTYSNLKTAYERELISSGQYVIYGNIARAEGFIEIGNIYDTTARNNNEHARTWLRELREGILPDTATTLEESAVEERIMTNEMYQEFSRVAKEEGFNDIAALFSGVSNIDFNHSTNFEILHENVIRNQVFCKPEETLWICMECGNIMSGLCAPEICPICGLPQAYYKQFIIQSEV